MKFGNDLAIGSATLSFAFLLHSVILLILEPAMGFQEFADFFDLEKIIPALNSGAWLVGNLMHVLTGFGLLFLAAGVASLDIQRPGASAAFGFAAAPLFVIIGMSGFVGQQLVGLLADTAQRDAALLGMIIGSRTMILYAAIALFGGMILMLSAQPRRLPLWLRLYGVIAGVAALVFALFPTPIPLILFLWCVAFLLGYKTR